MTKMKLYKTALLVLTLAGTSLLLAEIPQGPELGEPASTRQIEEWDIGVMPDGEGLPAGHGNAEQGKKVYEKYCVTCHGPDGAGGSADRLAGARKPLTDEFPDQTIGTYWPYATTLFDMIRRSMPMSDPGLLSDDQVYAVTAYLLYLNEIIDKDTEMNASSLPEVKMPNRDGFIDIYELENSE